MAIRLECYNIVIPIKNFEKCKDFNSLKDVLKYHKKKGDISKIWYDDYLYRDGTMGPWNVERIENFWEEQGLNLTKKINSKEYWDELCVIGFHGGPTLPCEWIEFKIENDYSSSRSWLKGTKEGKIIGKK